MWPLGAVHQDGQALHHSIGHDWCTLGNLAAQRNDVRVVGLVVDGHRERRGLDRGRAGHGLDRRLGPAIGHTEGEAAERRIGFEHRPDLLEEVVEVSVARRRIALLDVDLDLDRMLVVRAPEATKRLLRLARITVAHHDQAAVRDLLGQHAVAFDDGIGQRSPVAP